MTSSYESSGWVSTHCTRIHSSTNEKYEFYYFWHSTKVDKKKLWLQICKYEINRIGWVSDVCQMFCSATQALTISNYLSLMMAERDFLTKYGSCPIVRQLIKKHLNEKIWKWIFYVFVWCYVSSNRKMGKNLQQIRFFLLSSSKTNLRRWCSGDDDVLPLTLCVLAYYKNLSNSSLWSAVERNQRFFVWYVFGETIVWCFLYTWLGFTLCWRAIKAIFCSSFFVGLFFILLKTKIYPFSQHIHTDTTTILTTITPTTHREIDSNVRKARKKRNGKS